MSITRISDTVWEIDKTHFMALPRKIEGEERKQLLEKVIDLFEQQKGSLQLEKGCRLQLKNIDTKKTVRWMLRQRKDSLISRLFFAIIHPFSKRVQKVVIIDIQREGWWNNIIAKITRLQSFLIECFSLEPNFFHHTESSLYDTLLPGCIDDFTHAASWYFQRISSSYTRSETNSHRLVLYSDGLLEVSKIDFSKETNITQNIEENRHTVQAYREFLIREYGFRFLDRIQELYDIDFTSMIKKAEPLLPNHVIKCNLATHFFTEKDLEKVQAKLIKLQKYLTQLKKTAAWNGNLPIHTCPILSRFLSIREVRGIIRLLKKNPTIADLKTFLDIEQVYQEKNLISILTATEEELKAMRTGLSFRSIKDGTKQSFEIDENYEKIQRAKEMHTFCCITK